MSDVSIEKIEISLTVEQMPDNTVVITEIGAPNISVICPEIVVEINTPAPNQINVVEKDTDVIEIITAGPQGPPGPPGQDAVSDTRILIEAVGNIEAFRVVRAINATQATKADSTIGFVEARALGVATAAINNGDSGTVKFFGVIEDPSFAYAAGDPLFLGTDGQITDDATTLTTYNTTIGHGLGIGAIFIDLQEPVEL